MSLLEQSPLDNFLYALKSSESRRQYPKRFEKFLDFLGFQGSLNEKSTEFIIKARQNIHEAEIGLMKFLDFLKNRNLKHEIASGTVVNYYRGSQALLRNE